MTAYISGLGAYLPEKIITNADLEKMVETSGKWIVERTGIKERRIVTRESGISQSDIGTSAANMALQDAGVSPTEVDCIIACGLSVEREFPSLACLIQKKIGTRGYAFDVTAACSGFVYSLNLASLLIDSGQCRHVLIVGAEILSRVTDWKDRNTCILFGDGAGAALVSPSPKTDRGLLGSVLESNGNLDEILYLKSSFETMHIDNFIFMDGKQVYKVAVQNLSSVIEAAIKKQGLKTSDLDLAVFHQANLRILQAVSQKIGLPMEKVFTNLQKFGNTSAASIPIALFEARKEGVLKQGQLVALAAIGGGMTWGCNLIRW